MLQWSLTGGRLRCFAISEFLMVITSSSIFPFTLRPKTVFEVNGLLSGLLLRKDGHSTLLCVAALCEMRRQSHTAVARAGRDRPFGRRPERRHCTLTTRWRRCCWRWQSRSQMS